MDKRHILILIAAIVVFFAVLFVLIIKYKNFITGGNDNGNGNSGQLFDFKNTDLSYYEFMYDDPRCKDGNCIKEYIIHSNGLVFFRDESLIDGVKKTKINLGTIEKNKAEYLIAYTGDHMKILNPEGMACFDCSLMHIFFGDQKGMKSATSYIDESPQFMSDALRMTESEVKEIIFPESFFIHIVFQPLRGNSIDYHFYSDGTVLKEEFGDNNGEILAFNIYTIEKSAIGDLENSITQDHFLAEDSEAGCIEAGLKWGYIEIEKGNNYNFSYTCGLGNNAMDKLFKVLFVKTGGK